MAQDWYPTRIAELAEWHNNFSIQAAATGTTYGLTAAEVTQIAADAALVNLLFNYNEIVDDFAEAVTANRREWINSPVGTPAPASPTVPGPLVPGIGAATAIEARTREYANRIKASAAYNVSVGEQYGIVAPASSPDTPAIKKLTALIHSQVEIKINKKGHQAVAVDMRRSGGGWNQIGVSVGATFVDTTEPATEDGCEQREYRLQGLDMQNNRIGELSEIRSIVTIP